jgi:putative ABC transport system permease protein
LAGKPATNDEQHGFNYGSTPHAKLSGLMQTLTFKMLLRKRGTVESILTIALLIAILASITSVVNHLNSQAETIGNLVPSGETFIILSKDSTSITESKVDREIANLVSNATDIKYVLSQKVFYARLITVSNSSHTLVRGVDVSTFLEARHARIKGSTAEGMQANVGELLARLASIKVGDQIDIEANNKRVTVEVAGIIQTQTQSDTEISIPMNVADSLNEDNDKVSIIELTLIHGHSHDVIDQLREALPDGVKIVNTLQTQAFIQDVNNQTINFFSLWSIAVYVTVTATSYVVAARLTFESSYERAMLRALGWKRVHLFKLILAFTFTISLLGSLFGLAIGLAGAQSISTVARWTWRSFAVMPFLEIQQAAQIVLFSLAASTLGSIYPALKAMRKTYAELPL